MGKFTSALSRIGRGMKNIVTSDTTRRLASSIGTAAMRALESETGQKVVSGVVQGLAESALTDVDTGTAIKKAVIGNVLNIHEPPTDPLNPTEQQLASRLAALNREVKSIEEFDKHSKAVENKLTVSIEKLNKIVKNQNVVTQAEENQVESLDTSMKAMIEITEHENKNLQILSDALTKEARLRSRDEAKMIEAMKANYQAMANAVKAEKEAILEEAIEQSIDIGGEIAEHVAAEVPFVGESIATGMATARGIQQIYKLGQTISRLTGVSVQHAELPAISSAAVETLLTQDTFNDSALQKIVNAKIKHVEEIKKEMEHLNDVVAAEIKKRAVEDGMRTGTPETTIHHVVRSNFHIPKTRRPGVHIYTAPYDSDLVVIFLVVSPYSTHRAFVVCVDFAIDFVYFQEVTHGGTRLHKGPKTSGQPNFRSACKDFFKDSASHAGSTKMHSERLTRSAGNEPIYVTSMHYPYSYVQTKRQAEQFCKNAEIQRHILRGPLSMQRTNVLNAILHGVTLITTTRSRSAQGTRIPISRPQNPLM
uniref:Outer capsid protein VP5 n=1 Tax=Middle Point orbivirus TaxID=464979 RepID=A0A8K1I3C1_9REOV|nr:VP5 [Middle Point orbivirus]